MLMNLVTAMFENLPIDMRNMSAISSVVFSCFGVAVGYLYFKYNQLEETVTTNCVDLQRVYEAVENTGKAVEALKKDNHDTVEWIRVDNAANWDRIDDGLKEIRKQLYRGS
jgi:hypothetical protein